MSQDSFELSPLGTLSQGQLERLSFIDYRLIFVGELRRADLEERFGIAAAAATRDISCYRELAPANISYNPRAKIYQFSDSFKPLLPIQPERALAWLRQGIGDGISHVASLPVHADAALALSPPNIEKLAVLSRAIHQREALKVTYLSLNSGASVREIVPVALVDNAVRWHVRCYDRKNGRFGDFVVNRLKHIEPASQSPAEHELLANDNQWNQVINLVLVPHPNLKNPIAIEADYEMQNAKLNINVRAALAGYALQSWRVDCSHDHSQPSQQYHLWLSNSEILNGVESSSLIASYLKQGTAA
ncbi:MULTISPECIES: WYL domain-containing protein [Deefgea]|uniref:WYL domain-containing protein n=1 Tax=Deefgea chitinilytica TaxID=570276 RepID=A0ABS2C913_9NEIS|nr:MULTISPECIES: WYL domain-containing protein [Deefgea]MBM5570537.1 WYL domain-containing protein [Deefgea chitinilytica]MBM9887766.1 WYL domain-containing protein [Deefgea sp. CFH1-16]